MSEVVKITDYRCKECGGTNFCVSELYQNIRNYKVLKNGKISKKCTIERDLPMEVSTLRCEDCNHIIDWWGEDDNGIIEVDE